MPSATENSTNRENPPPSAQGFYSRWLGVLCLAAGVAVFVILLWYARRVFLLAFAGVLLAVFLQALGNGLRHYTKIPYGWSLGIVIASLLALLGLLGWLVGAQISAQMAQLVQTLPESVGQLKKQIENSPWGSWIFEQLPAPTEMLSQGDVVSQITGLTAGALDALVGLGVVLFVGLYGAAQPDWYRHGFLKLVPPAKRDKAAEILNKTAGMLHWWMAGQLFSMTVVGILTLLGLWLIGTPLPLALGLLAFGLEIVPNIGPILAAIPAILLAAAQSPMQALYVLLLYVGIHLIEGYILTPLVQSRAIHLPPAIQIPATLFFGMIAGFLGVLVTAPIVLTVIILVKTLYVENILRDEAS